MFAGHMGQDQVHAEDGALAAALIAGTHSGVGKTTVTLGLIGALLRRGLAVQPFKVGPDFIDPLHHTQVAGRGSRNLDGWMLDADTNRARFARALAGADVALIEGVMGLFDGSEGGSERGSSAQMAKLLGVPVVLVLDASAMARSAAALIHGFQTFDAELDIAGVILNRVGSESHARMIAEAVGERAQILGAIPQSAQARVPERHLGLHLPHETSADHREQLASLVEEHVDIAALLAAARIARPAAPARGSRAPAGVRIAIAHDEAFCFYYPDNLELLSDCGAELIEYSPLRDPFPADVDGLYIGGGYPELHAAQLAANSPAIEGLRELCRRGGALYAECGGLMYLGKTLTVEGRSHALAGVLALSTRFPAKLNIGYAEVATTGGLFGAGVHARGHVYHHSELTCAPAGLERCFVVRSARGVSTREGYAQGNTLASYIHLDFASAPELAARFVERCRQASASSLTGADRR